MLATNILTEHARSRSLGRAIAEDVIECVLSFGSPRRRHKAEVYTLNPGERAELLSELGPETHRRIERKLRTYVVVSDCGVVITAAYRTRRIRFQ
jgi:hypothetical protein